MSPSLFHVLFTQIIFLLCTDEVFLKENETVGCPHVMGVSARGQKEKTCWHSMHWQSMLVARRLAANVRFQQNFIHCVSLLRVLIALRRERGHSECGGAEVAIIFALVYLT